MNKKIKISFELNVEKYSKRILKLDGKNKEILGNGVPFLLVGYSENMYTENPIKISFLNQATKKYTIAGQKRISKYKIRPDTKLIFQLYCFTTNDDDIVVPQRVSESSIYLSKIMDYPDSTLAFSNKNKEVCLVLNLKFGEVDYQADIFEEEDSKIYDTEYYSDKIDTDLQDYFELNDENRKTLFTQYPQGTENMVFNNSFEFYKDSYCFTYLESKIGKTNEEFWENLLYMSIEAIWLESGKKFKVNTTIKDEKSFREAMDAIFDQFTIKEKINVMTDMLAAVSTNTPYTPDFVVDEKNNKIGDEDFFEIDMGYGDCDDLAKYIGVICLEYFKSITFNNKCLQYIRRISHCYISCLALTAAACEASYNSKSKNSELTPHLSNPWILKHWLFKNENIKEDIKGKIMVNPSCDSETCQEILENLEKIFEYEGNIAIDTIDGETLPSFLILEGTGKYNSTGDNNPLNHEYDYTDNILQKNSVLLNALNSKSYSGVDDPNSFYQYFQVLITKYFLRHPQFPTNIPEFTLTNSKLKSSKNDKESGYVYGESYNNLMSECKDTLFMCNIPFPNLKEALEISESISLNRINTQDLLLLKKKEEKIVFKPKYVEIDENGEEIEAIAIPPMLTLEKCLKLDKKIVEALNKNNSSNYKKLENGVFNMYNSYLEDNTYKIVIYDVKIMDMYKYVEDIFSLFEKYKKVKIISAKRNDITTNISNYRLFIKIE